ncbi:MAG: nucleoside hydrolase [Planctomycetaceae bacterium]|jgi:purine nucleosidase|nr:nucleoside hydrolase [Planctomycetaceae bacterium]
MPKKVLLDVDPGIVDAMALCLAVFDPTIEIVAITSVGGNVPAPIAAKNLQAIIEFLDPPRLPRLGMGSEPDEPPPLDFRHVYGIDGLGGTPLPVAELRSQHPAEKVICDAIHSDPENIMIICMGPLTNIARAIARDPELPRMIRHLYITGGTVCGRGNVSPCAEFNIFADVQSAHAVFRAPCTKTLIPLDVTNQIMFTLTHFDRLPDESYKLGQLLRSMILPAFNAYRQCYALEGIHVHDLITYVVMTHPEWFETQEMAVDIETEGHLTRGMTVFDLRNLPEWPNNIDVVTKINTKSILREIILGLRNAADQIENS